MKKQYFIFLLVLFGTISFHFRSFENHFEKTAQPKPILTGADQLDKYLPYLKGKRVAMMANPTSIIGKTHLVDSLSRLGVNIVKVFGPEHGFRGNASAGRACRDLAGECNGTIHPPT